MKDKFYIQSLFHVRNVRELDWGGTTGKMGHTAFEK